jgi:MoaA/NifB/PqqE/SkfB family radical SAM enzyme
MPGNLRTFPLKGLQSFVARLKKEHIRQISFTGTNTDPQLYQYESELIGYLRQHLPGLKISLHTNGVQALSKIETFNLYDRASISFPSFDPNTYQTMTGSFAMLDLSAIIQASAIPIKISILVTKHNIKEIPAIITRCRELGISRMVLRKPYGETPQWDIFPDRKAVRYFGGNPVYDLNGMEVTIWDFSVSKVRCINLFSDGSISQEYKLTGRNNENHRYSLYAN